MLFARHFVQWINNHCIAFDIKHHQQNTNRNRKADKKHIWEEELQRFHSNIEKAYYADDNAVCLWNNLFMTACIDEHPAIINIAHYINDRPHSFWLKIAIVIIKHPRKQRILQHNDDYKDNRDKKYNLFPMRHISSHLH